MFNSDHPAFKMSNLSLHRTEAISLAHYSGLVLLLVKRSCLYLQEFASFFVLNFDQTQCFTESLFQLRYYVPRGEKYEVLINAFVVTYFWYRHGWWYIQNSCCRCARVCVFVEGVWEKGRKRKGSERKSESRLELNMVHHRWLLFRIPGSWSHAVLALAIFIDPVGYELIKRNTSLDIVSTLLSDYRLSTEIGLLQQ